MKADFIALLRSLSTDILNRSTTLESLPPAITTDLRYISLRPAVRDPLIEAHTSTLDLAPIDLEVSAEEAKHLTKEKQERERREQALAERQRRVQEEKQRQHGALRQGKGMLREGEYEVERAMKVGKQGLLGHMEVDKPQIAAPKAEANSRSP